MPVSEIKISDEQLEPRWYKDMRGWIMVVAVLVASITYSAGLNPPGGVWQDDFNHHIAGYPILHDNALTYLRYKIFFYANATAFMASLVIIVLFMNENVYNDPYMITMLVISMVLDVVSLMIAYAAGCARHAAASIYVIVLAVVVLLLVVYTARVLPRILQSTRTRAPWVGDTVSKEIMRMPPSSSI